MVCQELAFTQSNVLQPGGEGSSSIVVQGRRGCRALLPSQRCIGCVAALKEVQFDAVQALLAGAAQQESTWRSY